MADVWANSMACHPGATCHIAGCCNLANSMSWSQSYLSHCRVLPPGEFNGMSSQSHVSHCRVLPLGEFTFMIPEPHATLQGAVTWRNQCHDRATLQGVIIPSAILKIVLRHILLYIFNAVWALTSSGFRIVSDTLVMMMIVVKNSGKIFAIVLNAGCMHKRGLCFRAVQCPSVRLSGVVWLSHLAIVSKRVNIFSNVFYYRVVTQF